MIVRSEGADLHVEAEGSGPTLLMIPGAGGSGARFAAFATALADRYTVVRYDRRANGRSGGDPDAPMDMAQQARDAAAVARAFPGPAHVFATSGGAVIALALAGTAPYGIAGMLLHEPPVLALLDDAAEQAAQQRVIREAAASQGTGAALRLFMASLEGIAPGAGPPPDAATVNRFRRFFAHEFDVIGGYEPDIDAVSAAGLPTTIMVGSGSGDAYYARSAKALAERLGIPMRLIGGHHLSFATDPETFARDVSEALSRNQRDA